MNKFIVYSFVYLISLFLYSCQTADNQIDFPHETPVEKPDNPTLEYVDVDYIESDSIIFNPERGFYKYFEASSSSFNKLTDSYLSSVITSGKSLIFSAYTMLEYRDKPIAQDYLDLIEHNMLMLRKSGVKTILRFRYTNSMDQTPWDSPQELVYEHVQQLKPILQKYTDVIYVLEAGFIGVWGEWAYTDNFIRHPEEDEYAPRRCLLDALLDALPTTRMVSVRYPRAKLYSYNLNENDTVTIGTAFDGSPISRIAMHNDCFLADFDDRGTFRGIRFHKRYWAAESKYLAMGGETCGVSRYSVCENGLIAMAKYHWSYLNEGYHHDVAEGWQEEGCIDEIAKRLGYRFVLLDGQFSAKAFAGEEFSVDLNLVNTGFASPVNPRSVELVFVSRETEKEFKYTLDEDPRLWFPKENVNISTIIKISSDIVEGEYDIYLHLPDPEPTLYGKLLFSIRFANEDVWDYDKGYNKLHTLRVSQPN